MERENNPSSNNANEVFIEHAFNAPVELVFRAFTDPAYLERWYAPNGCNISYKFIDVTVGGRFHSCISDPKFGDCWCVGVYKEIVKNKKISYDISIADELGNLTDPATAGMDPDWPMTTRVDILFREENGKTHVTLHQSVLEKIAKRTGAHPSWIQMLRRLENILVIK
ncbi:ATPase [Sphingobacteriaceae bacterium]|nr:ATPase [Sphingobacteriaceae bacterium]